MFKNNNLVVLSFFLAAVFLISPVAVAATQSQVSSSNELSTLNLDKNNSFKSLEGETVTVIDGHTISINGEIMAVGRIIQLFFEGMLVGEIIDASKTLTVRVLDSARKTHTAKAFETYKKIPTSMKLQIIKGILFGNSSNPQTSFYNANECVYDYRGKKWLCKYSI